MPARIATTPVLRIVLAPDSFKGSLAAPDVCAALARGIVRAIPDAQIRARPMADGGEGTLDAVLTAVGAAGRRLARDVAGADGAPVHAAYGVIETQDGTTAGPTAVIEVAQVVGITDARAMAAPVADRSTRGVGELVVALLDAGVRRFMIGLGGSSTNDGGSGLLAALGVALLDADGRALPATPRALTRLARVDAAGLDARVAQSELRIMSDVNNPLTGALGATAVFGPQKGVAPGDVAALDATLGRYAALAERALGATSRGSPAQVRPAGWGSRCSSSAARSRPVRKWWPD